MLKIFLERIRNMTTKLINKSMAVILAVLITAVFAMSSQQAFGKDDPNAKPPKVEKEQAKGRGEMGERIKERIDELSKKLELTEQQKKDVKPIFENEMKEMRTLRGDLSLTPEQRREKTKAIRQTTKESINKILTPEQQKKFAGMKEDARENRQGMVGKRIEMLSEKLELTEQQKKDIKPIIENEAKEMQALRSDESLAKEQRQEKMKSIRQTTKEAINKILTPEQQKKYAEMEERPRGKMAEQKGEGHKNREHGPADSNSK